MELPPLPPPKWLPVSCPVWPTPIRVSCSVWPMQIRDMLSHPAKFAPSRNLPPLTFNNFLWDTEVMSTLGIEPEHLPLALITSKESDMVRDLGAREGGRGGEGSKGEPGGGGGMRGGRGVGRGARGGSEASKEGQ